LVQDHSGTTPLGLSSDFEAPTLNGRVALLADKFATLHGPSSPPEPQIMEPQVVEWLNRWWTSQAVSDCTSGWAAFNKECESFLGSMVASIQTQAGEISTLASEMAALVQSSTTKAHTQPADPILRFPALAQGLQGNPPGPSPNVIPAASLPPDLIQSVQIL
jgi:hypothetical protein